MILQFEGGSFLILSDYLVLLWWFSLQIWRWVCGGGSTLGSHCARSNIKGTFSWWSSGETNLGDGENVWLLTCGCCNSTAKAWNLDHPILIGLGECTKIWSSLTRLLLPRRRATTRGRPCWVRACDCSRCWSRACLSWSGPDCRRSPCITWMRETWTSRSASQKVQKHLGQMDSGLWMGCVFCKRSVAPAIRIKGLLEFNSTSHSVTENSEGIPRKLILTSPREQCV